MPTDTSLSELFNKHFEGFNQPKPTTKSDSFEARFRDAYFDVCQELNAIDPEDYEYAVRLEDCATSLAALISFVKDRAEAMCRRMIKRSPAKEDT